ncbi:hypothetical protein FVER53590_26448 [Fusarium verticillioides]|nr:hypothetical protein FVER53590_26448 [Fusarium verticillioides]
MGGASRNPFAKDIDIVPSHENYDRVAGELIYPIWLRPDPSLVFITPRGLIVAAAEACVAARSCDPSFFNQVLACPHEDMTLFTGCLKCYRVNDQDIDNFETFIRKPRFTRGRYNLNEAALEPMQWSRYPTKCHRLYLDPDDDGSDGNVGARAVENPNESYIYQYTMSTLYPISNGPTPRVTIPSAYSTEKEDEDGEEYDTGSASTDVVMGTTTFNRKEAAPTATAVSKSEVVSKNDAGRNIVVNVDVLLMVSVFRILL